jgi:hypothetical protein
MRKFLLLGVAVMIVCVGAYGFIRWRIANLNSDEEDAVEAARSVSASDANDSGHSRAAVDSLPALDAHGITGVREITRTELVKQMTSARPLTADETANLDRGCPGFVCVYQGLGLKRWPEQARGTAAYLTLSDALNRQCPAGQKNFIFVKQGCWLGGHPPMARASTGEVSITAVTRTTPGLYTFNYAVYFPSSATYAWMNHRDYGFPLNRIKPQKAYLSLLPPPLSDYTRPAQIYCSTCR